MSEEENKEDFTEKPQVNIEEENKEDFTEKPQVNMSIPQNDDFDDNEMYKIIEEKEKAKPLGFLNRIISLIISPIKLVENLKINPNIAAPTIVLAILSLIYGFIYPAFQVLSFTSLREIAIKHGASSDIYIAQIEALEGKIFSVVGSISVLSSLIFASVVSCAILLLICKIFGGKGKFIQYFSLLLHINIIYMFCLIIAQILSIIFGTINDLTTLSALFMPNGDISSILYNFLTSISISSIWTTIIIYFGVKEFNDFTGKKPIIITASVFIVQVLFSTLLLTASYNFLQMSISAIQ